MDNFYDILGIEPDADLEEIQDANDYKKKSLQKKMAKAEGNDAEQEKIAKELQKLFKAFKTLSNAASRDEYDQENGLGRYARQTARPRYEEEEEAPAPKKQPIGFQAEPAPKAPQDAKPAYTEQIAFVAPSKVAPAVPYDVPDVWDMQSVSRPPVERPVHPLWIAVDPTAVPTEIASKNERMKKEVMLFPKMANRHGLIAGATGTGKTVTVKVLAEHFSDIGVPVFLADVKGDVWTMCKGGSRSEGLDKRIREKLNLDPNVFKPAGYPVRFWDVYGKKGVPVRTTISAIGPELLARMLELNETQTGVLNIVFRYADENGLPILDMKDLRTMVNYCANNASELQKKYGNIAPASVGAIQRGLLRLEDNGGNVFFGEPALDLHDWFQYDRNGRGVINMLHCAELFQKPIIYSTFLLWMLSGLYDMLPEKGDADKPEIVFFFDEAHLIFKDAPKSLLDKVEQIVRLIRSKGVGIYFISQIPADIPDVIQSQLGNKVQHALRAYDPQGLKALKATAACFRSNTKINAEKALTELKTGEALVSFLYDDGTPGFVQRAYIMPPNSTMDVIDESLRFNLIKADTNFADNYKDVFDRESAYEILQDRINKANDQAQKEAEEKERKKREAEEAKEQARIAREEKAAQREAERQADREAAQRRREEEAARREEEREYKRQQAEEEREYKRRIAEEERQRKQEEREYARRMKEEEAARRQEEREAARRLREEEAQRRADERNRQQMINAGMKVLGGSSGTGKIIRGIFGSLFK